jgi:hypothetical protein
METLTYIFMYSYSVTVARTVVNNCIMFELSNGLSWLNHQMHLLRLTVWHGVLPHLYSDAAVAAADHALCSTANQKMLKNCEV